ncbi:MAG: 50S ribosomal protein L21 [Flavobacteriales bacterium]|nr:50S ribosomal protein L21 [Flavobacteriales bacterium]|tara:strand:- start:134 stop:601 length:468 start_codon:yes stop_codon:yes gene_type:complete
MYAIVEISGQQFKVEKDQKIFVNRLAGNEGDKVSLKDILLIDDGKKIDVGSPKIAGAEVKAKLVKHIKGDKVVVFKKKRRKGYRVKNGHRSALTEIEILDISRKSSISSKKVDSEKTTKPKGKSGLKKKSTVNKKSASAVSEKKVVIKKESKKKD